MGKNQKGYCTFIEIISKVGLNQYCNNERCLIKLLQIIKYDVALIKLTKLVTLILLLMFNLDQRLLFGNTESSKYKTV